MIATKKQMKKLLLIIFSIFFCLKSNAQIITTVAGGGNLGDGGLAVGASLSTQNIAIDSAKNIYIADFNNNCIRKVNASTGIILTVAGNGIQGFNGDGGPATTANLRSPSGVAIDRFGNIYISDYGNNRIRKVDGVTGYISTIVGNGTPGYGGDGGAAISASINMPTGITIDSTRNIYIADYGNNRIRKVNFTGIITTIAGNGTRGYGGDGGIATSASLNFPNGLALDLSGNIYIADKGNNRIRKVTVTTGIITTLVGNGIAGSAGDGGLAAAASLYTPTGVSLDSLSNLYIADANNSRIRKVNSNTGIISTIAGNATNGGYGGDGGIATAANLSYPTGLTLDGLGNIYISDAENNRIRKINASTGIINTVAGNGSIAYGGDGTDATSANIYSPLEIVIDNLGNFYFSDQKNNRIRKVNANTGIITTIAGNGTQGFSGDGSLATSAKLNNPTGLAVDEIGNIFISDYGNNRIRKVSAITGIITTLAGNGTQGYGGDGGIATAASLNNPTGITLDKIGNLYIADASNNRIRKVFPSAGTITTIAGNGTGAYGGDGGLATSANLFHPSSVTLDSLENIYIADNGNQRVRKINSNTNIISTLGGNGVGYPKNLTADNLGYIYITDYGNSRILKANVVTGLITTIAGIGSPGFSGDGGLAAMANLNNPSGIAIDKLGNVFVSDNGNNRIRKIYSVITNNNISSSQIICTITNTAPQGLIGSNPEGSLLPYEYLWLKSITGATTGFNVIPSSNSINYNPGLLSQSTWYRRVVISGNLTDTSAAILISIKPKPSAGFTTNSANQCVNTNSYVFADTTIIASGTLSRLWTLGNGDTTSNINPSKVFSNAGTYNIKLLATSDNGCKDSLTKSVIVYPNTNIGFKVNTAAQCINGNSFLYTDTSNISTGTFTRLWNFGDASAATTSPFTKTYSNANTYQVKLVTTSNNACKDSITKIVTVNPKPDVYFMNTNPSQCLKGNLFSFPDSSFIASGSLNRTWYLGDGSIDTNLVANKSYTQAKTYQVKLVVTSNNACQDSMVSEVIVHPQPVSIATAKGRTSVCPNEMVNIKASSANGNTYQWLKNEVPLSSSRDSILQISEQGIYKVITSTAFACIDTSQGVSIVVNPLPKANFGINNAAQCMAGNLFQFVDSSTLASGSLHRIWYLNNVLSDTAFSINKSYNAAGNYSVKLVAFSVTNCKDSITKTITVHPQPTPDFTINNPSQCLVPNSFVFTDVSSIASGSTTRTWYTGNGINATTAIATQVFNSVGNRTVKLVSKSDKACSDSISKTITVNANPLAGVMLGQTTNVVPTTPYIYTVAQQLNHTYLWSVTNGIVVAGQGTNAVTVQWIGIGSGKIQAIITNPQGCNDTSSLTLSVTNVGIKELQSLSQLELYPNPNNGDFTLKITSAKASETRISLLNLLGQEVWADSKTLGVGTQEIDLNTNVAAGVYVMSLQNEDGQVQKSVVVR